VLASAIQSLVAVEPPSLLAAAFLIRLPREIPDLGCDPLAIGLAHTRRIPRDLLRRLLHLLPQLSRPHLGFGIEVSDPGYLDELLLRLPEARNGVIPRGIAPRLRARLLSFPLPPSLCAFKTWSARIDW
jgi:hypothetical protein